MVWQEITATILEAYQLQLILKTTDKYKDSGYREKHNPNQGSMSTDFNSSRHGDVERKSKKKKRSPRRNV